MRLRSAIGFVVVDQTIGGRIVCRHRVIALELGQDTFCELFSELHAPLIEGIDLPDDALHEDLVFVKRDERAQAAWRELLEHDRIAGSIARKHPVRQQPLARVALQSGRDELGAHLIRLLAAHQGLGLREEFRQQNTMVIADGVVRLDGREEVAGNEPRALMDELIERVLAVSAGLAPDHGTGVVIDYFDVTIDALAVALHVALLEIGGKAMEILIVGQDGVSLGAEEIVVPDTEQRAHHRQILLERRRAEMFIHLVRAGEQFLEPTHAQKSNILRGSMPKAATACALVESATKCVASAASSLARAKNHVRALWALVRVSWVVKVLEAITNSVVSGSSRRRVSLMCVPSILETKCGRRPSLP